MSSLLHRWYNEHGRHDLAWRHTRDPWVILVSEVMLQQTPVSRVSKVFDSFIATFPTPNAMAEAGLDAVIREWDRLGYPRRARNLYATSIIVARDGWPDESNYESLPGVGSYTAAALRALTREGARVSESTCAQDVNIVRVCSRYMGEAQPHRNDVFVTYQRLTRNMHADEALLSIMDLGAVVCTKISPDCTMCPLRRRCATQGVLEGESKRTQKPYVGSFRQKRGDLLRQLRVAPIPIAEAEAHVLASLLDEGFVHVRNGKVSLATSLSH